ncbi:hypothetical protein [Malikia spinosa]|uniref:SHOCT domain-containing protein n=1 Tax=Malikia spinosa TaxID=86180 RepID=A0A7C9JKW7_9BURK|nr:hypothetical protein [Malikia spinosa]MYZ51586.1 hypothetical protein [Malikia spinosa]
MKNLIKMIFWAGVAYFILVAIVVIIGDKYTFPLPNYLAERHVGPAPVPTEQELSDMNYPREKVGLNYKKGTIDGDYNNKLLALNQYVFMMEYRDEWRGKVGGLAEKYVFAFRALSSLFLFGALWMFKKATLCWWVEQVVPLKKATLSAKLPVGVLGGDKSIPELVGDGIKQRQLKKQHEEFQQLESLLRSGLITQAQFDVKKYEIAAKIQKVI